MSKFLILFLPLWLYGEIIWQQSSNNTSISLELSPATPLELILRLQLPQGAKAEFPLLWQQDTLSAFRVIAENATATEIRYVLEPLFAGDIVLHIPPFSIIQGNDSIATYTIPPIPLRVAPVVEAKPLKAEPLVRANSLNPVEISRENALLFENPASPQEELEIFKKRTFPLSTLLFALAVIAMIPALLLLLRKRPEVKLDNSRITLLKTLKDLESSLNSNTLNPEQYQNLNVKMREYIQERFGINAPFLTTEEFLEKASEHENVDNKNRETLKTFLKESDRVKFKGKNPTLQDLDACLKLVHKLIKNS